MAVELSAGRIGRQMTRSNLVNEPADERVKAAISSFVEYPAGPWRQGSSPYHWTIGGWADHKFELMFGLKRK